jgi:NAD(P)H-nitrite reductase large subunit
MARNFQHSFEVCTCKHVTLGELIFAIKEKGAKTLDDLKEITDAGSACGCCKSKEDDFTGTQELYLTEVLDKFANK